MIRQGVERVERVRMCRRLTWKEREKVNCSMEYIWSMETAGTSAEAGELIQTACTFCPQGDTPQVTYGASQPLKTSGKDHGGLQDTPNQGCGGGDAEMFNPRLNNNLRHYGVCMYVCMWQ